MSVILTSEQELFVDTVLAGHNVLVDACVGSGKTTAIQELCRRSRGRQILYLTYNKLLKLDAQARIRMPGVYVQNYHGFAWTELARNGIRTGVSDIISNYMAARIAPAPIDLLVLDEYQDINSEIAGMLDWLKACCPGMVIAAVGDMRQKLYDWTRMDVAKYVSDYLGPARVNMEFTTCFRLSAEHASAVGGAWDRAITGANPGLAVEKASLREAYRIAAACDPKQLLVLGRKSGEAATELLNRLERDFPERFNKNTVWCKIMEQDGGATQPTPDCAVFTTYDGSKGMERDTCIICDYTEQYWKQRLYPETANPDIVRNIFLVAASRGKSRIVFVDPGRQGSLLDFDTVKQADMEDRAHQVLFDISSMFDFKFSEDIEDAAALLDVRPVYDSGLAIDAPMSDGLIDLSPCVGMWTEASYFEHYDIMRSVERARKIHPNSPLRYQDVTGWSTERLILYTAALETGQARYVQQVAPGWVPPDVAEAIHRRLSGILPRDADVQRPCRMELEARDYGRIRLDGVCDAYYGNLIWELKFTTALTAVHKLQLACYLLATGMAAGRLFNVRTGELLEIRIRDRAEFASQVVRTVTKNISSGVKAKTERQRVKDFAVEHPRAFREMEAFAGEGSAAVLDYLASRNLEPPASPAGLMKYFRGTGNRKTNGKGVR